jgi:hypothetical protein
MCPSLSVPYTSVLYGRPYHHVLEVEWDNLSLPNECWLLKVAENFFSLRVGRRVDGVARAMQKVLKMAEHNHEIRDLISLSKNKLDVTKLPYLFALVESDLRLSDISERGKYIVSKDFRHMCCHGLENLMPEVNFDRRVIKFTTSFGFPRAASKLLSDAVDHEYNEPEPPLGALPHKTYQELYNKTKEKVSADLERLRSACYQDLTFFQEMRKKLIEISKAPAPRALIVLIQKQIWDKSIDEREYQERAKYSDEEIVSAYMEVYDAKGGRRLEFDRPIYFSKLDDVLIRVAGDFKPYFKMALTCFHLVYRCVGPELLSIFILMLCHFGWNPGSLIGMEKDTAEREKNGKYWKLQGFKDKTDDYTPPVYVERDTRDVYTAMETLHWHHNALLEQGLINANEQHYWFAGVRKSSFAQQVVGILPKTAFLLRHNIPRFSFSYIRNQVFERDRLEGRNVESIRRKAGHRSRDTTVGYLDSLVSRRMFSSINLEFSRRLENTVIFRLVESGKISHTFDTDLVRTELFSSLGDGSYCADKNNPPGEVPIFDGVCAALSCHCDGGCANRKIIIDDLSLKDLVRKRIYYLNNWRRLENNNPAAFQKFHFDSMAYVLSLYEYIKNSRYKFFLDAAVEDVEYE